MALSRWLDVLVQWNAKMDLTAARSIEELVDLMIADACAISPSIPMGANIVDVGTGAGAPGLALALLRPDLKVTLVEPLVKRVSFLRTVLGTVNRSDVTVQRARLDELENSAWDVAVSRATLAPEQWLREGLRIAKRVGVLLAREASPVVQGTSMTVHLEYAWPLTHAMRTFVVYERVLLAT